MHRLTSLSLVCSGTQANLDDDVMLCQATVFWTASQSPIMLKEVCESAAGETLSHKENLLTVRESSLCTNSITHDNESENGCLSLTSVS